MQFKRIPKTRKLIIFGDSQFAEVAYECFTHDSEYEVVGFAVEQSYLTRSQHLGLPVVPVEQVTDYFLPESHDVYAAVTYTQLNRLRARLMHLAEEKGYALASYVSSWAMVWPNVKMGKHCFIFLGNTVQPFVSIGDNVVLWTSNIIGHHTTIRDHAFISGKVGISGACDIGKYCFLGGNTTVANDIIIGDDCFLNISSTVIVNLEANKMYRGQTPTAYREDARAFFGVT